MTCLRVTVVATNSTFCLIGKNSTCFKLQSNRTQLFTQSYLENHFDKRLTCCRQDGKRVELGVELLHQFYGHLEGLASPHDQLSLRDFIGVVCSVVGLVV